MFKSLLQGHYAFAVMIAISTALMLSCQEDIVPQQSAPGPVPGNLCSGNFAYGYCNKISYAPDEMIIAFLHGLQTESMCRLNIYDINGAVSFSVASPLNVQRINSSDPSQYGFGFSPTVEISIPSGTKSGVYLIEKKIPFIVKSNTEADILVVYPSNTANAYAVSGGKSLYSMPRVPEVSFHRPIGLQSFSAVCLQWFTSQTDLRIAYVADIDLENYENIKRSKIITIVGHNEYWTRKARQNFDEFVNHGGHALILSGNTMWWQVRYTDNLNGLICYREEAKDPERDPLLKTIEWTNPSLEYDIISSIGADFPRGGYGLKSDMGWNGFKIANSSSPLLEGLNLPRGSIIQCPSTEYDGAPIASFDAEGFPILDQATMNVYKAELIAFDKGFRVHETYGTFIALQRKKKSGIVINTGTTDWCSSNGMGGRSGDAIKKITRNAITKLLNEQTVFSK